MVTGWQKINGMYYYFRGWGGMYRSTFFQLGGETYYADADGKMVTGWLSKENQWYYFRENGAMYRNTFFIAFKQQLLCRCQRRDGDGRADY